MTNQISNKNQINNKLFELSVDTLVRLRGDTNNAIGVLANILKEGMLQRGNYEIGVIPTPGLDDTLVRVVHPKNTHRASIDMKGNVHVLISDGAVQSFPMSKFDEALDVIFQQIVQRV